MITYDYVITVKGDKASLDKDIYLYRWNRNVDYYFTIRDASFIFEEVDVTKFAKRATFKIIKPNGDKLMTLPLDYEDYRGVKLRILGSLLDDLDEIGDYSFQIDLYDGEGGRITIPPVIGQMHVLEPIFDDGDPYEAYDPDKGETVIPETGIYANRVIYEGHETYKTVQDALDALLYNAPVITDLRSSYATLVEMGTIISSVTFNWLYNKAITSQTFAGISLDKNLRTYTYTKGIFGNTTLTLVGNDGKNNCSKSVTFTYANKVFYGVSSSTTYNAGLLNSLSYELSNSKGRMITVNPGESQHIIYAIPVRLGECKFAVGGFEGGFQKVSTISYTNSQNYTENYNIYRSDNPNLGNTTVVVS